MGATKPNTVAGQLLFYTTLVAIMVFFWWLLIYDHGVEAVH